MPMFDGRYHSIGNSIENLHYPYMDTYQSDIDLPLNFELLKYFKDLRSTDGKTTGHIIEDYMESKTVPIKLLKQFLIASRVFQVKV